MQSIRVAAVSMNSPLGEHRRVLKQMGDWCRQAADAGAELVLFPELVVHGHCSPDTWTLAEKVPDGESIQTLEAICRQFGLVVSAGLCERDGNFVYNTQVLVGPDGYIGKQRKLHMSRDEGTYYKSGRQLRVFDIGKCKVGMSICYDNQFPEPTRILALKGADILLMPHAARMKMWEDTPESIAAARQHTHDTFVSCYGMRARENGCFVVLADQAGRAGHLDQYPPMHMNQPHHAGAALIFDPWGNLLAETQCQEIRDEMLVQTLEGETLDKCRSHPNYTIKNRRPELFGALTEVDEDG